MRNLFHLLGYLMMFDRIKKRVFPRKIIPELISAEVEEEEREEWDRPAEFFLSLIGCSIGKYNNK